MRNRTPEKRSSVRLAHVAWIVPFVLFVQLLLQTERVTDMPTHGFVAAYTAGRVALEEGKQHQLYDHDAFRAHVHRFEPDVADINVNPPTFAVMMTPWARLPYSTARTVWIWFSFVALMGSLGLVCWELRMGVIPGAIWFSLALGSANVLECLRLGQVYLIALLLWVIVWMSLRRRQTAGMGLSLGTLICWKLLGPWMLALLARSGRYRDVLWSVTVAGLWIVASILWLGGGSWNDQIEALRALTNGPETAVTAYQTVTSLFRHLFSYHPGWNPDPVLKAPLLAVWGPRIAALCITGIWVAGFFRGNWRENRHPERMLSVGILVGLILSPVTLDYHYPLTLLPIAVLAQQFFPGFELAAGSVGRPDHRSLWISASRQGVGRLALFLGAVLLIHADLPYRSPRLAEGIWALFAYPKLYGTLILIGMSMLPRANSDPLRDRTRSGRTVSATGR